MKRILLILALISIAQFGFSQVGINTTSPNAQLDIKSSNQATPANNDGILIPKIDKFPVTNPTAAQNSMMVYLTTLSLGKQPGFYYWNEATTSWKGFGSGSGWNLDGNSGTNPAVNFIGTTDNTDLVFRRNFTKAGFIGDDNVAFGTTAMASNTFAGKNIAIGKNALFTQSYTNGNSAFDTNNIAIGIEALYNNNPNSLFTGKENTVIGNFALRSNSTGNQNVAIGNASLNSNSVGFNNVSIGNASSSLNFDGNNNTALGTESLISNKSGSSATAIGYQAMRFANSTSSAFENKSVAVGYRSLLGSNNPVNNTGNNNTAIGYQSIVGITSGNNNTAVGNSSLINTNSGSSNVAIGNNTLSGNTSGSNNIAIGDGANVPIANNNNQLSIANVIYGTDMSSMGTAKIGIGVFLPSERLEVDGKTKTTTFQMTTGASAGRVLISDAVGNGIWTVPGAATGGWLTGGNAGTNPTLNFLGTTDNNDFIFKRNNTLAGRIGATNTAFGVSSLSTNTGNYNNAFGYLALNVNNKGNNNTAIGVNAALNNSNASQNIAIGANALQAQSFANGGTEWATNNVAVGIESLYSNNPTSNINGNNNTAVGNLSLRNNTTGSGNLALGVSTLLGNTTGSNNIAIGTNANVSVTNNSNQLSISNVLYGIDMNAITTGKIGIGLTIPTEKLQVSDNIKIGNTAWSSAANNRFLKFGDGDYVTIGEEIGDDLLSFKAKNFLFNPYGGYTGNVGIGVLAATEKLEVAGKTKTTDFQMTTGGSLGRVLTSDAIGNATWQVPVNNNWNLTGNAGTNPAANFVGTTDNNDLVFKRFNFQSGLLNSTNTSFGVAALNVVSTGINNAAFGKSAMSVNTLGFQNTAVGSFALPNNTLGSSNVAIGTNTLNGNTTGSNNVAIGTNANVSVLNNSNQLSISNVVFGIDMNAITTGKIGIGLTIPTEKLQVSENIKIGNNAWSTTADNRFIKFGDGDYVTIGEEIGDDLLSFKAKNFLFNPTPGYTGNVGIGIIAPTEKLEVVGKTKTTSFQMTNGAALGRILTSDGIGNASWQIPVSSGWLTTGNAGTNSATNFIGTTDNNDVVFKRFNIQAGLLNTTNSNTSFGVSALNVASTGTANTAVGKDALAINSTGLNNTAVGVQSLLNNLKGSDNIGLGNATLFNSKTASKNIAIGTKALRNFTYDNSGVEYDSNNIAIGYESQLNAGIVVDGSNNTAIGNYTLSANRTGRSNIAIGLNALKSPVFSNNNVAIGISAMENQSPPQYYDDPPSSVAIGSYALRGSNVTANNTGFFNVAIGEKSMYLNSTGLSNTAIGYNSMFFNDKGNNNVVVGAYTLTDNKNASNNIAIGVAALSNQNFDNAGTEWETNNIAIGTFSLFNNNPTSNVNGNNNTALGSNALRNNTVGFNNTAVGYNVNPTAVNISNYTGVGYNVGSATSTDNMVEIGNTSVLSIRGQVNFTTYSDQRIKNNIQENVPGLSFITQLRPVTYNLDIHKQNEIIYKNKKQGNVDWDGKYNIEKIKQTGFIAQEVVQAAAQLNYDFSGIDAPKDANSLYGLRYAEFVVPLVKAVQEQQEIIEVQNLKIKTLEDRLKAIEEKLSK